jgi:hypothetical protein
MKKQNKPKETKGRTFIIWLPRNVVNSIKRSKTLPMLAITEDSSRVTFYVNAVEVASRPKVQI